MLIILYIAIEISDFKVAIISCTNSYLLLWQIYNEQRDGKTESVCYLCAWTCRLSRKTTLASSNKMISMSILLQKLWKLQTAELMLTSENMCFPDWVFEHVKEKWYIELKCEQKMKWFWILQPQSNSFTSGLHILKQGLFDYHVVHATNFLNTWSYEA